MHNEMRGQRMSSKILRLAFLACLMATFAFAIASCGDDDKSSTTGGDATKSVPEGKKGGAVTVLASGDVDYMDPGQSYYTFGYQVLYSVQRSLYYFSPENPEKQIPDLAEAILRSRRTARA